MIRSELHGLHVIIVVRIHFVNPTFLYRLGATNIFQKFERLRIKQGSFRTLPRLKQTGHKVGKGKTCEPRGTMEDEPLVLQKVPEWQWKGTSEETCPPPISRLHSSAPQFRDRDPPGSDYSGILGDTGSPSSVPSGLEQPGNGWPWAWDSHPWAMLSQLLG